jgi:hypothetical protein
MSRFILKRGLVLIEPFPIAKNATAAHKRYFSIPSNDSLLHKTASVRRSFESSSNAQVMLISGGSQLASNASFDPHYTRAKDYIRKHAVGQAVLTPILLNGMIGALVESQFPQGFMKKCTLEQKLPLIVGCEVEASLEVVDVKNATRTHHSIGSIDNNHDSINDNHLDGLQVDLVTKVIRVSDGKEVAVGTQTIWLPEHVQYDEC